MDLQNLGVNNVRCVQSENGQYFLISFVISELFFGSNWKITISSGEWVAVIISLLDFLWHETPGIKHTFVKLPSDDQGDLASTMAMVVKAFVRC